jgi:hypothetical protein
MSLTVDDCTRRPSDVVRLFEEQEKEIKRLKTLVKQILLAPCDTTSCGESDDWKVKDGMESQYTHGKNIDLLFECNKVINKKCTCPQECDCQDPEPLNGVALVSNLCPVHNLYPMVDPECPVHNNEEVTR